MKKFFIAVVACFASAPVLAHHPLAGQPMETFSHGLLSGIGHPILGFDHFFFIAAMSLAALFSRARRSAPVGYITAMLAGCGLMAAGIGLPLKELVIAISLLAAGIPVLRGQPLSAAASIMLFTGFGLFHGSAFGDTLAAQEAAVSTSVLIGYLVGLALIQYVLVILIQWVAGSLYRAASAEAIQIRLAGAAVVGVGLFLSLEYVEAPLMNFIF